MQGGPARATYRGRNFTGQGWLPQRLWLACSSLSFLQLGVCPKCGLCVYPSIPVSGQVPWGLTGCLGPGQTHPGVSIETADPGCEFLVLEKPAWWL